MEFWWLNLHETFLTRILEFYKNSALHNTFSIKLQQFEKIKLMSLPLEGEETLKYRCACRPSLEKLYIVSNDHRRTQKYDFCVSVCKTNFTDHHIFNTIHCFRDSVLVCKMHDCMIRKMLEHFHSFPSSDASDYKITRLNEKEKKNTSKCFLNVFNITYTYSNCIIYQLFYCWEIIWPRFAAKEVRLKLINE